jgi:hypothetical protein
MFEQKQKSIREYAIRMVQEITEEMKLNEIHQLLVYADDVHLLKENTEAVTDVSKEAGLEVKTE